MLHFFSYTRETDERSTPYAKNDRRTNSLDLPYLPLATLHRTIAVPQRSPGIKYARMSFVAASLAPISMPIPTLAVHRHSILLPRDSTKVRAEQGDGGVRVKRKRWPTREVVISKRCDGKMMDPM